MNLRLVGRERARATQQVHELLAIDRPAATSVPARDPGTIRRRSFSISAWLDQSAVRLDPGRRAAAVVAVLVLIVALATACWMFLLRPNATPVVASSATPTHITAAAPQRSPTGSARA